MTAELVASFRTIDVTCPVHGTFTFPRDCENSARSTLLGHSDCQPVVPPRRPRVKSRREALR